MTTVQPTQSTQNNGWKYAAIGATTVGAGVASGAIWYNHGNDYIKDGKPTDKFISSLEKRLTETKDKDFIKDTKWLSDTYKEIDNLKTSEEAVDYFTKNVNWSADSKKIVEKNMKDMKLEDAKRFIKASIEDHNNVGEKYTNYFNDLFEKVWDKDKKKLVFNSEKISKNQFECVKDAAKTANSASVIKVGALAALATFCLGSLISSLMGKSGKNE